MKVKEKLMMDMKGLVENGPITIVAFGDSVTHGAVTDTEINYETVYWNRLRKKLNAVRAYVPVNVIDAGIGGDYARNAINRMDRQVFKHEPDLIIVCFGLNDVNGKKEQYIDSLRIIFQKCNEKGIDTVFMTPNMLNTYVAEGTIPKYVEYAKKTAQMQNGGKMDDYIYSACDLAREMGITVCDCYSEWKRLAKTEDTTLMLANRINHPTTEMHELFAQKLFDVIMGEQDSVAENAESTMFRE